MLCNNVSVQEYGDLRALINAIRAVFHLSEHVYCSRHITENVQRHLTDHGADVRTRQQAVAFVK